MATIDDAVANFERNIEAQTGRSIVDWGAMARADGREKHGQMVAWLKTEGGMSHGYANHIAKRALEAAKPRSSDDPVAHIFEGKEDLRPLYERLVARLIALGDDVEILPKKANVSIRRRKQFALLQPSTRTRLDLGLILKDVPPSGRLEPSGSFNAMFTHRIKIADVSDLDSEVDGWIEQAYAGAA